MEFRRRTEIGVPAGTVTSSGTSSGWDGEDAEAPAKGRMEDSPLVLSAALAVSGTELQPANARQNPKARGTANLRLISGPSCAWACTPLGALRVPMLS